MKYVIASDIHGSAYYARLLKKRFEEEEADILLLLGDLLYHGARNALPKDYAPKEVTEILNGFKDQIYCVRGNCDSEVDQMVMEFSILVKNLLMEQKGKLIHVTHGHEYTKNALPPIRKGDILLTGHTHVPACERVNERYYLNPGSTSIPKEGSAHSYMTLEDGVFLWKDIETGKEYKRFEI